MMPGDAVRVDAPGGGQVCGTILEAIGTRILVRLPQGEHWFPASRVHPDPGGLGG